MGKGHLQEGCKGEVGKPDLSVTCVLQQFDRWGRGESMEGPTLGEVDYSQTGGWVERYRCLFTRQQELCACMHAWLAALA